MHGIPYTRLFQDVKIELPFQHSMNTTFEMSTRKIY